MCHVSCASCTNNTATDCLSCAEGYAEESDGTCSRTCDLNQYFSAYVLMKSDAQTNSTFVKSMPQARQISIM